MIDYLKTTLIILGWVGLLSVLSGILCMVISDKFHKSKLWRVSSIFSWPFPTLILAPVAIAAAYHFYQWSSIVPSVFEMSEVQLIGYCFIPSFILFWASGLLGNVLQLTHSETKRWSGSPFYRFSISLGVSRLKVLAKLVFLVSQTRAWQRSLPWLFGELIVAEAMFNAPGVGLDLWHLAKSGDELGFLKGLSVFMVLFFVIMTINLLLNRRLSQRLQTYA